MLFLCRTHVVLMCASSLDVIYIRLKRWQIELQKVTFYRLKGHLLHSKRQPFATAYVTGDYNNPASTPHYSKFLADYQNVASSVNASFMYLVCCFVVVAL